MYKIEFNTGDYEWDNEPEIVICNSLEEVKEELGAEFSEDKIKELKEDGLVFDDTEESWVVKKYD